MTKLREIISENTPISIGLVISLIGAIFWITNLYAKTEAMANSVLRIETSQQEYNKNLMEINQRLSHIEGSLKIGDR